MPVFIVALLKISRTIQLQVIEDVTKSVLNKFN